MAIIKLNDLLRAALFYAVLIGAAFATGAWTWGDDLANSKPVEVEPYTPVILDVARGQPLRVVRLEDFSELPAKHIHRGIETATIVPKPGSYLIDCGGRFGVIKVAGSNGPPLVMTQTQVNYKPAPTDEGGLEEKRVWVYTGPNCPPCELAKEDWPELKAAGIKVIEISKDHSEKTPTFILSKPGSPAVKRAGYVAGWTDASGIREWFRSDG